MVMEWVKMKVVATLGHKRGKEKMKREEDR